MSLDMFGQSGVMISTSGSTEDQPGQVGPASYLATIDGGHTWNTRRLVPDAGLLHGASFADPSHGWVLEDAGGSNPSPALLATTDAGRHWTPLGALASTMARSLGWTGVQLLDPTTGWVWAEVQNRPKVQPPTHLVLLGTANGAKTWHRYDLPSEVGGLDSQGPPLPPQVFFSGPDRGWVLSVAGLWRTTDGGLTWTAP